MASLQIRAKPLSKPIMTSFWLYTQEHILKILINYVVIGLDNGLSPNRG